MRTLCGLVAVAAALLTLAVAGRADEEKVPLKDLPKAVTDAIKAKFPKAELVSAEKEKEEGKVVYEVNIKDGGVSIDVTVTPEGKILVVEKEIPIRDVPKVVLDAVATKYPKATVTTAEEVMKDDKLYGYMIHIATPEKKMYEVEVDPKGKILEVEEKKEEKKPEEKKEEKKPGAK